MAHLPLEVDTRNMNSAATTAASLSVAEAAARVGLTAATLRTWDRRYDLSPSIRTAGGHRRYNEADIERLRVAARLLQAGYPAAEAVAASALPHVGNQPEPSGGRSGGGRIVPLPVGTEHQRGLARAAMALDGDSITSTLSALIEDHGVVETWNEVISPVLVAVGDRWARTGEGIDVEHVLAHGVTSALLGTMPDGVTGSRPVLLGCAPNEEHVLPLLALHSALLSDGTPSVLLGNKVPAAAMSDAVKRVRPRKIGLWAQLPQHAEPDLLTSVPPIRPAPDFVLLGPGWSDTQHDAVQPASLQDAVTELSYGA